ncbi:hypothetical protein EGW08_008020 [Elysia chlorotica]|uniref:Uncharacterized protein n=1 Tax=Elysia chlorotica TaxID=188477 RepID=A0A3S1BMG0_ELYCH|nr:hypothetical protein EGW08_008020 [Elysia chlorotica]
MTSSGNIIDTGDSTVHFTKLKASQMAEVRSVLKKRPKAKFSVGLSPEAQEAMQQVQEDCKIQEAAKRGKRGSKGSVLFSDFVHICHDGPSHTPRRRPSFADVYSPARLGESGRGTPIDPDLRGHRGSTSGAEPSSPRRCHGRRRSSVTRWVSERPPSVSRGVSEADEVDQVLSANLAPEIV